MSASDPVSELDYLRRRVDELWSALYEGDKPEMRKVAYIEGVLSELSPRLKRLEEKVDRLAELGIAERLARLERQTDNPVAGPGNTAPHGPSAALKTDYPA